MSIYFKKRTAASVPTPAVGKVALFLEAADGLVYLKDETGTVFLLGVPTARQVIAGAGLTGGGSLVSDVTLNVVANADGSIIVNANDILVGVLATDAQHGNRGGGGIHTNAVPSGAAGFMTGADKSKLDGIASGAAVASVGGTAPIVSSGGTTPSISINAATTGTPGSLSAADKTKLDSVTSGAAVASVGGTAPIVSSGGTAPAISITPATTAAAGSLSATDKKRQGDIYNAVADFGFVGDLVTTFDGACATGAPTKITSATAAFTTTGGAVIGQRITLAGAGAAGTMYVGTITNVDSATQVTVSPNISTTVSSKGLSWGTDNTTAISNMTTLVNTTNAAFPGITIIFPQSPTNSYGFPTKVLFNQPVQIVGIGGGHTSDTGDYTRIGGTRLAWWGASFDGGTAFSAFFTFSPTGVQALKRVAMRSCWLDCRNGDQNQALFGLKLASCQGFMLQDFFINDALAGSLWADVATSPTEAKDTARFSIKDFCSRQLDNPTGAVTTPILMTSAVVLTTTPQSLTVASNTLPTSGYLWTATTEGTPVLVNYTGGGGTTTLTGCTIAAEFVVHTPTTVNGGNVVQAVPGNGACLMFNGSATANVNLGVQEMLQLSHGTTWGPAALEHYNSDSIEAIQVVINGGNATNDGAINRVRKPGVRLNGSIVSATLASRNNVFRSGSVGVGGIALMGVNNAGARLTGQASANYWYEYQLGNGEPMPVVEGNAGFFYTLNGGLERGAPVGASVANQAIANALTQIAGTLLAIPPQGFQVGTVFRWTLTGLQTTAAAAAIFTIRIGTAGTTADAAVLTITMPTATVVAATGFRIVIEMTVRTLGAAATVIGKATVEQGTAGGIGGAVSVAIPTPAVATFNSTTAQQFIAANFISGNAGTTLTFEQAMLEIVSPSNP